MQEYLMFLFDLAHAIFDVRGATRILTPSKQ